MSNVDAQMQNKNDQVELKYVNSVPLVHDRVYRVDLQACSPTSISWFTSEMRGQKEKDTYFSS